MERFLPQRGFSVGDKPIGPEHAIKGIANNSTAIDVYCWLAYRLHSLSGPKLVTWAALRAQFGRAMPGAAQFKYYFKVTLELALAVYPDAKAEGG